MTKKEIKEFKELIENKKYDVLETLIELKEKTKNKKEIEKGTNLQKELKTFYDKLDKFMDDFFDEESIELREYFYDYKGETYLESFSIFYRTWKNYLIK